MYACYKINAGYSIRVEVSVVPPALHRVPNPSTLTCLAMLNGTLGEGLAVQMSWSKDDDSISDTPKHTISEVHQVLSNTTQVMYFESALTMQALKPGDNGTYACSALVVRSSTKQPVSKHASGFVVMQIDGE